MVNLRRRSTTIGVNIRDAARGHFGAKLRVQLQRCVTIAPALRKHWPKRRPGRGTRANDERVGKGVEVRVAREARRMANVQFTRGNVNGQLGRSLWRWKTSGNRARGTLATTPFFQKKLGQATVIFYKRPTASVLCAVRCYHRALCWRFAKLGLRL